MPRRARRRPATCGACCPRLAIREPVAKWAADTDPDTRAAAGLAGPAPSESTFAAPRRGPVDAVVGGWAARRRRGVDGTLRGSGAGHPPPRHLLAALDHDHRVVLAQADVGAKTGEAPRLPVLLAGVNLADVVVTADTVHAQQATAGFLHDRGASYVLTVKRNQPTLFTQLTGLPRKQVPAGARTCDCGHGQVATCTVKAISVRAGIGFPHATQAVQAKRRRRGLSRR